MSFVKVNKKKFLSINLKNILSKSTKHNTKCEKHSSFITQLAKLLQLFYTENINNESLFTKKRAPYIIGINGSVSSGKSHLADELYHILKCFNPTLNVGMISTDNFLYSNKILQHKKIFDKKGFTESYNWRLLFKTLKNIKKNKAVSFPYYSQNLSDIQSAKNHLPANLNILIIEGINLLKPTCNNLSENLCKRLLLSDYIDYSIYLDTPEENLKNWFYKRLVKKKTLWKRKKIKKNLTRKNKKEFKKFSNDIWDKYNSPNLKENINPFRYRSDLIIHKTRNYSIDFIEFKI
jgi:type I pantothenate kinase